MWQTPCLTIALAACALVASFAEPAPPVHTYTGFYTGAIIPTPQEAKVDTEAWEVADSAAKTSQLSLIVSARASETERLAAQEIAARIGYLSGGVDVPIKTADRDLPTAEPFIALGRWDTTSFVRDHLAACGVTTPEQPEGYAIGAYRPGGGTRGLLVSGRDLAGVTFSAQTLVQLFERRGDKVLLHPTTIRDWPVYRLRSFKTGGAYDTGGQAYQMGLFAPFAKFNCYNLCYSDIGPDKWVAPDPSYREFVADMTRYMRARGLDCMPFVNPYDGWKAHIQTSDEGDLARLFDICRFGPDAGGTRVMLCLDDFASEQDRVGPKLYHVRSARDRAKWGDDLAAVNIAMANDLHRRLKAAHPQVHLYAVLPYYWNPSGYYQAGGEEYLRKVGKGLAPDITIVWTGPQVRSAIITKGQLDHYQELLGGRKVMLWDNTLYMYHNPPHYFLDTFHTRYPERFWELGSGEVHLNAGGGASYECGLLSAADYLWNPGAFDPDTSLRHAVAALAGPELVDDLLAFRDAFYGLYDQYAHAVGAPKAFLARAKAMTSRPFDEAALADLSDLLGKEKALADKIAARCTNADMVGEVRSLAASHDPYREALTVLAKLPPLTNTDAANIAPNPDAEQLAGDHPAQWATYTGAGRVTLANAPGRTGGNCGKLTATGLYDWGDGRHSINVALMIGDTNGFEGAKAPPVLPLHGYYFSFWLKGTAPRVVVSFVTWDAKGSRDNRGFAAVSLQPLAAPKDWTFYSGSFIAPADAARGALKIGVEGYTDQGAGLGEVCVDDIYVGRSKAAALKHR